MSNEVILNNVSKAYGNNLVLNKLNLCVKDGELVSLLGSSGCGKTTALRIIAGFLTADTGRLYLYAAKQEEYRHGISELCVVSTYVR